MVHLSPLLLTEEQLLEFAAMAGWTREEVSEKLLAQLAHVFLVAGIWLLLAKRGPALWILGAKRNGPGGKGWVAAVQAMLRLARDWECDCIMTSSQDLRVGKLIELMGGRPYEVTYRMEA